LRAAAEYGLGSASSGTSSRSSSDSSSGGSSWLISIAASAPSSSTVTAWISSAGASPDGSSSIGITMIPDDSPRSSTRGPAPIAEARSTESSGAPRSIVIEPDDRSRRSTTRSSSPPSSVNSPASSGSAGGGVSIGRANDTDGGSVVARVRAGGGSLVRPRLGGGSLVRPRLGGGSLARPRIGGGSGPPAPRSISTTGRPCSEVWRSASAPACERRASCCSLMLASRDLALSWPGSSDRITLHTAIAWTRKPPCT